MIISDKWLREWITVSLKPAEIAQRLTLAGLEVASVTPVSDALEGVVVGEIKRVERHPHADQLTICDVNVGKGTMVAIVCGAANARAGLRVPVAQVGTRLPKDVEIREATVRGVVSQGMLCSAAELGLAESSEGLLELEPDAKPGQSFYRYWGLDDVRYEIDLTPNRGDCLSVAGIARELAALTGARVQAPKIPAAKASKGGAKFPVKIEAAQDCPRYVGQAITGINAQARSPRWLTERLRRSGIRSIHPVVDVTNYVMLELGQPMHAFDLKKLAGGIVVRHARAGEKLRLLDGSEVTLPAKGLVIADRERALALAGVMGGQGSGVGADTTDIFLESAYFNPQAIGRQARALGLHTDSSHRFERGVDPMLQERAMARATALLLEIVGGHAGPVQAVASAKFLPKSPAVTLRAARLAMLLGTELPAAQVKTILSRLGMKVTAGKQGLRVVPPSYRFDLEREVDLIEEIARIYGYDKLPSHLPTARMHKADLPETDIPEARLRSALVDRDFQEVIAYSFIDPKRHALLHPGTDAIALANPIASNMAVMRTSLWAGLLEAVAYNRNRQQTRIRLFEIGRRFGRVSGRLEQTMQLAGVITGPAYAEQWGATNRPADFFDLKGDVEALLALTGSRFDFRRAEHPALHPGQSAEILAPDGSHAGWIGCLHPRAQAALDLDQAAFLFELDLSVITQAQVPKYRELSKFPSIRRDIAVVVDVGIPAQAVLDETAKVAGNLLVNLELFDEYRGEGIDSGRKSLGLALTLQDSSLTLSEETVDAVVARVVTALQSRFSARLRQ